MSEKTVAGRSGLFSKAKRAAVPVPLAGVSIQAEIHGFYATVVVAQRYINREATAIEAVYVFPLDEGAAVKGFEAIVDGTLVVGEIHEREKAFEIYDDAMEAGHGAFLLDEERADVFQASIGNLLPGKEVLVKLTYVIELNVDDGRLRFTIPTTVSPRYAPAEDRIATGRPDSETLNPPVEWRVPYGLNLTLHVRMPGAITAVESPSHPISVRMHDGEATIALGQANAALDRDFVLSIDAEGLDAPHAIGERGEGGAEAIGIAFAPTFTKTSAASEVVFLVDRSGSMEGQSIEEVRNALQLCLRSLTPGCRFNIVGFGSRYEALFPETRPYEQASLSAASAYVAALEADLGGTEILEPLRFVLDARPSGELPRQVVVLTDGQVTNTDAVIALAGAHASRVRIFTFGIGAGASHHLVRGLARAGGGAAEFIYPGERIEPKVLRQFARLLSPALTDVRIEWLTGTRDGNGEKSAAVTQAPSAVPPVFAGGRLLVYGFVKTERPSSVRLSANGPSGPLSFDVQLPDASDTGRTISTLAARARIRELEEGSEWLASRGSRQQGRRANSARNEIIELSLRYGLMSRETSFVAVERREAPAQGEVALRRVPIALTSGWGGLEAGRPVRAAYATARLADINMPMASPPPGAARRVPETASGGFFDRFSSSKRFRRILSAREEPGSASMAEAPGLAPPAGRRRSRKQPSALQALVILQEADGSWAFTRELASALGQDFDRLRGSVQGAKGSEENVLRAWGTALALAWLQTHAADAATEWRLLAEKARGYLAHTSTVPPSGGSWMDAALAALS